MNGWYRFVTALLLAVLVSNVVLAWLLMGRTHFFEELLSNQREILRRCSP